MMMSLKTGHLFCRGGEEVELFRPIERSPQKYGQWFFIILLALFLLSSNGFAAVPITNNATLTAAGGPVSSTMVDVLMQEPTPSGIAFLQYAPGAQNAQSIQIPDTFISEDGTPAGSTQQILNVYAFGSTSPIDFSSPVPLVEPNVYHQGEPVFIVVTDLDQNYQTGTAESVWVRIRVDSLGESELLLLTETGPDTGVFAGVIQSAANTVGSVNNGILDVTHSSSVVASYTDPYDGTDVAQTSVLVDPFGIVFDSSTGEPVDHAIITLVNADSGAPAVVYGDDGLSTYPSTIESGASAVDSSGRTYDFPPGGYRFPLVQPGRYRLDIDPPETFRAPSQVDTAKLQTLPGGPFAIKDPGSRGEVFVVNQGPPVHIDIPVDPVPGALWLTKSAGKTIVAQGDFISYTLELENTDLNPKSNVTLTDLLPMGFRLKSESVKIDGVMGTAPDVSPDGRTLLISLGEMAAGQIKKATYVAVVGSGVEEGEATNTATAKDDAGNVSNTASVTVTVKEDLMRSKNIIVGRVVANNCGDEKTIHDDGVEGVSIYLEDGTYVITDHQGMFHFEGVSNGVHVVQMDTETLPSSALPIACEENTRFAGSKISRFVDLQGGTLWRTDFHVSYTPPEEEKGNENELPENVSQQLTKNTDHLQVLAKKPDIPADGFLSPLEGDKVSNPINSVRVSLDSRLKPKLLVDGMEISQKKIGFRLKDPGTGKTMYSYIGVDLGGPGTHTLEFQGTGPFGNARFKKKITIVRTGEITAIRLVGADGNVADGKTPVTLELLLLDNKDRPIGTTAELEIKAGNLKPLELEDDRLGREPVKNRVIVDTKGIVRFAPVSKSGLYRATLSYNGAQIDVKTYVRPKLRDEWIIVGLAEGTAGYNTVTGNMENLDASGTEEELYKDGRVAFYAKGKIKGKWLLTLAYDSEKERKDTDLFQTIDPGKYYTLYGDDTNQQYDASSIRKVYIKLEREQFYALFGDYNTGISVTELSRYERRLNGIKTEYNGETSGLTLFAADTGQVFKRDEIQGDGTSGLYRLSAQNILVNSEKIVIETRNRFHSEDVIKKTPMTRYVDYTIDYDDGTLFFKFPVFSKDESFNPIYIVAEYETQNGSEEAYTYGGRGSLTLAKGKIEAGATYVHEGPKNEEGDLGGVDVAVDLGNDLVFKAEAAATRRKESGNDVNGEAYLAEITKKTENLDAKVYFREQGEDFGLGMQNSSESGTRKMGIQGRYRLNKPVTIDGELFRQYDLTSGSRKDVGEAALNYDMELYSLYTGMRYAQDSYGDGSIGRSTQLRLGGKRTFFHGRAQMRLDHEQSLFGNNGSLDYPTRTILGADYQLTENIALYGEQELTWGEEEDSQSTRIGLKATPWSGGNVGTSLERSFAENDERIFANLGLYQTYRINENWSMDAGFDRSHTLKTDGLDAGVDDDFTAISLGAGYDETIWSWAGRVETRFAEDEDKWGVTTGMVVEPKKGLGLSAGLQVLETKSQAGQKNTTGDIRLGMAWRPKNTRWIVLDRLDLTFDDQKGGGFNTRSRKIINNLNVNYKPDHELQIAMQYGAKYVVDTLEEDTYKGYTDLWGVETRYDLTKHLDVGVRGSMRNTWSTGQIDYSAGVSVGWSFVKNVWVSLGYNFVGFDDKDFSASNYTSQGPFVRFRLKIDQKSVKDMVNWFGKTTRRDQ